MWRSRMFWHQFGTYAVLILASLGLVGVLVANRVERDRLQQIEERLRAETVLIQELIRGKSEEQIADLHQRLRHLGQRMGTRITLIAADGRVLADSAFDDASGLDNHLNRPEIQAARAGQPGTATRFSTSVGQSMLYVTLHTAPARQAVTYVRAAVPLHDIEEQIAELRRLLWTAAGLTALVALGVAFLLARRVAQPLQELTEGAERIAAGAYGHKVYTETRDEVGTLARAFNQMSDRLAAQFAQLDEDRQKLRTVLSSMTEGVLAVDTEQRVLFANERAAQLLEFPPAGAVGRRLWELVRQRPIHEIVQRALVEQDCQGRELDWTGPSAKTLRVHVGRLAGSPPRGAVLVFHDTSELRRLENLRQEFVANVSHELKTPLSVIKACVETLLDGAAEDAQHRGRFLERIQDQADRLHMLILDLLSLARIESGTATFHFEAVDLQQVAQACQERHRARAEAKQQQLLTVAPANATPAPLAWADEEAVSEILDNLVDNAVKYTPAGGRIQIRWWASNAQAFLEVQDTGIGIAQTELPRIFERFYRVDRARSREMGGTGLGLSIVKHLAQAMDGAVSAASELGNGSTFTIRLPTPAST